MSADVDLTLLRNRLAELENGKPRNPEGPPLKSGDGGGTSGGMDARLSALESRFDRFEAKLDTLIKDVAEMKGRISAMPSTWQLLGMILAIMGASFAIVRFGLGH
jgi:hypothetical protein